MASIVTYPRMVALDDNGDPLPGAKAYFFDAGTTTTRDVYSDAAYSTAHTVPVVADSAGMFPQIFINPASGNYKVRILDADDVQRFEDDDISPQLASPVGVANGGTGAGTAAGARTNLDTPSTSVTDALNTRVTTLEATDAAAPLIEWNDQAFAASFTPDYSGVQGVRTTLTAGVTINAPSNLVDEQQVRLRLTQDGTGNRSVSFNSAFNFPGGVVPNFSVSPSAVDEIWGIADGTSSVDVQGWRIGDARNINVPAVILEERYSSGTDGGSITLDTWTDRGGSAWTEVRNIGGLCSVSGTQFTLPDGTYRIQADAVGHALNRHRIRLYNVTSASEETIGLSMGNGVVNATSLASLDTVVSPTTSTAFKIQHRSTNTRSTEGLGQSSGMGVETYARVLIWQVQ